MGEVTQTAVDWSAITASDDAADDFARPVRAVYVGGAGDVAAVSKSGSVVTFAGVAAGSLIPIQAVRINSTNTTATSLVALY